MNQSMLLHIVERLESLLGKLPATIQKPILHELTPLKELFLQQRPPRFVFSGSVKKPAAELLKLFFGAPDHDSSNVISSWQTLNVEGHGTIEFFDARGATKSAAAAVAQELKAQPPDIVLFFEETNEARRARKAELENLISCADWSGADVKVIGFQFLSAKSEANDESAEELQARLVEALQSEDRVLETVTISPHEDATSRLLALLSKKVPNQARVEMIRIARDRDSQREIAQVLVKSTSAICAAIGAQPIPLADMPILTTLQLVMVSGIMYVSGRERSLRAATEFAGAVGANVGAGLMLREGARAILKFVPGWGNVISGMIAGAGTYAIGRAAMAFFLEGVSLREARRTYLNSRKRRARPDFASPPRLKPSRTRKTRAADKRRE